MSKTQKQATISPFIYLPLGGAAVGGLADYAIGRRLRQKAEVDSNGKKIKTPEGETDAKENARRLLRSLILGGGVGLGLATVAEGGTRVINELAKTGSAKKSKLLAKLVKQAAEENNFFSDPKSNYLIGGMGTMLGSLALYHFLNDKKKRNLLGYLGSGLTGLGAGLAGAGLFNKNRYGTWLGIPEANKPEEKVNNNETNTPTTTDTPTSQFFNTPAGKDTLNWISSLPDDTEPETYYKKRRIIPAPTLQGETGTEEVDGRGDSGGGGILPWLYGLWGGTGAGSMLLGAREGWKRQSPGKGTPDALNNRTKRQTDRVKSWDTYNANKWNHPILKSIFNVSSLGERPIAMYGNRLGNWLGEKGYNLFHGNKRLSRDQIRAYDPDVTTPEDFKATYGKSELPLEFEEPRNWNQMTPQEQAEYRKNNVFPENANGEPINAKTREALWEAERNAVRMEQLAKSRNPEAVRLAKQLRSEANKLWANSGVTFGELPEAARKNILSNLLSGNSNVNVDNLNKYKYKGNKLLKELLAFDQVASNPNWFTTKDNLDKADVVKDYLPQEYLDNIERGRFGLEAKDIKSPIEGMNNRYVNAIQQAYNAYEGDPTDPAKYDALKQAVDTYREAIKAPKTFGEAGFGGGIANWKYTNNPETVRAINDVLGNVTNRTSNMFKPEVLDALDIVKEYAPSDLRTLINRNQRINDIISTYNNLHEQVPERISQELSHYRTNQLPENLEKSYNFIENVFAEDMAKRYPAESTDLSPEFRSKVKNGEYPKTEKLVKYIDHLQSKINALEQFSDPTSSNLLYKTKAEYTSALNKLLTLAPTAGNTPKARLLRGGVAAKGNAIKGLDFLKNIFKQNIIPSVNFGTPGAPIVTSPGEGPQVRRTGLDVPPPIPDDYVPPIPDDYVPPIPEEQAGQRNPEGFRQQTDSPTEPEALRIARQRLRELGLAGEGSSWVNPKFEPGNGESNYDPNSRINFNFDVNPTEEQQPHNPIPEEGTGNPVVDKKLNEINKRRNATEPQSGQGATENADGNAQKPSEPASNNRRKLKELTGNEVYLWEFRNLEGYTIDNNGMIRITDPEKFKKSYEKHEQALEKAKKRYKTELKTPYAERTGRVEELKAKKTFVERLMEAGERLKKK